MIHNEDAYDRAVRRNIINNARKTFFRTYPRAEEVANFLYEKNNNEFLNAMHENLYYKYGKLTEKQYQAVCNCIDKYELAKKMKQIEINERKEKSNFVGKEGARLIFSNILVEKVITIDAPQFHYRDRCTQEVYLLKDANDNRIVYRTKNYYPELVEGEKVRFKATIKEHKDYKGEKQTVIQRLAFI